MLYWAYTLVTDSYLRNGDDPPRLDRHGRRLAPTSPATGHHLSPRGKPCPQSPAWWAPAAPNQDPTPPSRGARPPPRAHAPERDRHHRHARHASALVQATDRPEV